MSKGAIYIASGKKYIEEAKLSAKSLKKHNPNLSITIFTDRDVESPLFDDIIKMNRKVNMPGDSLLTEEHIVYDKNLFLDSDTHICSNIMDVFELLDTSDIALAHAVTRTRERYKKENLNIPDAFPEYNSGVVAYNDSKTVRELFDKWQSIDKEIDHGWNQVSFRYALYKIGIDVSTLPPEYNFRTHVVGFASGPVKIVHGRPRKSNLQSYSRKINSTTERRVVTWDKHPCRIVPTTYKSPWYRVGYMWEVAKEKRNKEGTASVINSVINRAVNKIIT
ncbi:hypothetical protein OB955_19965 [Halobacteria archaeon AArc-m2/3/4]|uniref:Nucleotide-diphospho-sugar transferase n=1 Tax=Natronoglomus mannanivorans TaxID=2979990 RepID=A0ABT2QJA1_9EURY|nr:hypothetical protein [Halobacteria archaeon AArc-m2/3/4]